MVSVSRRVRRAGVIALLSVALVHAGYVAAVFLALRLGALQSLTEGSRDFKLAATGGYSFWPTRVVLHDVRFRFKDYNIEMDLEAERATVVWSPLWLLQKTVEIDEFRAAGVRYELLHRVKHEGKNRRRLAAFPDTGFERAKVYDSPKPPYGVPPLRIVVRRIEARVEQAWLLEYRAEGSFEVSGGFELHEQVEVFPSQLTFRGAQIFVGQKRLAQRLDCDVSAHIGPFPGREDLTVVLGATSGRVACRGDLDDLSALGVYVTREDLLFDMGATVDTKLELHDGQLRSSSAEGRVAVRRFGLTDAFLSGDLRWVLGIQPDGNLRVNGIWRGDDERERSVELREAGFALGAQQPKLLEAKLQRAQVEFEGLEVRDPTVLRRLAGGKAPLGKLEQTQARFAYHRATAMEQGKIELQSRGAMAVYPAAGRTVSCGYELAVGCQLNDLGANCPLATLGCAPLLLGAQSSQAERVSARLRALALEWSGSRASSEWVVSLSDPKEVLQVLLPDTAWTDLGLALAPLGPLEGRARVNRRGGTTAGTIERLESGPFSAQGGFVLAESFVSRWRLTTPLGRFGLRQGLTGVEITPFVPADWNVLAFGQ